MKKQTNTNQGHLSRLDLIRGIAILMVVIYHWLESFFGASFLIVPDGIFVNLSRLKVFQGGGIINFLENAFAAIFAYGFAAVNVFVVLSGFVLTWSLLRSNKKPNWTIFYWKKFKRILLPLYIAIVIGFLLMAMRNWIFPSLSWWPSYEWMDWLKFFLPPFLLVDVHWLQQLDGNYWYITLVLQLYLLFPLLYWTLQKMGVKKFLLTTLAVTIIYRLVATYGYHFLLPWWKLNYLDTAPMGVISNAQNSYYGFTSFLPRLFEFTFGMALAGYQSKKSNILDKVTGWVPTLGFLIFTLAGFALDSYRAGWIFSDLFLGVGLFGLLLNIASAMEKSKWLEKVMQKAGDFSYELYLVHGFVLSFIISPILQTWGWKTESGFWLALPIFLLISILAAWMTKLIGNNFFKNNVV